MSRTGIAPIADDAFLLQMAPLPAAHQDAAAQRKRLFDEFQIEVPVTQHVNTDGARIFVCESVQPYISDDDLAALEAALVSVFAPTSTRR